MKEKMEHLYQKVNSKAFLKGKGTANEVLYYIYDYNPSEELEIRQSINYILKKSETKIININLLELLVRYFENEGIEALAEYEMTEGTYGLIKDIITPIIEDGSFIDLLKREIDDYEAVFITGVGSSFQFIRLHEIFSKLGDEKISVPIIGFYPGEYTMETLKLFGIFESQNYYRAFKL